MKYWTLLFLFLISLNSFAQDSSLVHHATRQLDLDSSIIYHDFIVSKVCPNNTKETIMVIPIIVKEEEDYLQLNAFFLIINNETGKIINKHFERTHWVSDAIELSEIIIDTAPYNISENDRAFGIRVHYYGRSQPNPYSNSTLSLFIKSNNKLKRILNDYEMMNYGGEWDMNCDGASILNEKMLIMKNNKTNGHYDILVKDKVTETKTYEDENGDCQSEEEIIFQKTVLKFNGEEYTENGIFRSLDVYLNDPDLNPTNIRQTPNGKIIQRLNEADDYFTLTITEENDGWFKLVKVIGVEGNNIKIEGGTGWIHHSVLEVSTRRKVELLDIPQDGIILGTIDQEIQVRIKDRYLDWVKIEYQGLIGWIESKWICGNPVTTCP